MSEDAFDFAKRELCPDEACIGLVGPDGRCKECGKVSPSAVADPRHQGMADPHPDEEASDFGAEDGRELCPDDACVGLIGPDGHCKVCGKPGAERDAGAADTSGGDALPASAGATDRDEGGDGDDFGSGRRLCPDGACIGLIGPDGRCKVCGRDAGSAAEAAAEPEDEPAAEAEAEADDDPEPTAGPEDEPAAEADDDPEPAARAADDAKPASS